MKVHMHCIHQDAEIQKAADKQDKLDEKINKAKDKEAAKKINKAKKDAKSAQDQLTGPMLVFEEEIAKLSSVDESSYLLDPATRLLARVKQLVAKATQGVLGEATEWDMNEVKDAKEEMVTKTRNV